MNSNQPTANSDQHAGIDQRASSDAWQQLKLASSICDRGLQMVAELREIQETAFLLLRQVQVEQTRLAILAELQRRDLEADLERIKKIQREYTSFEARTQ